MNRAKSTRRVMLLSRMGSPTCRLHTGRPWLAPSSRSLPRTTVHRMSLANTRRHASTWSSRSAKRVSRASGPNTLTHRLSRAGRVSVDRALDDLGVVRRAGDHRNAPLELAELPDALLAAHADDFVASIKRMPAPCT